MVVLTEKQLQNIVKTATKCFLNEVVGKNKTINRGLAGKFALVKNCEDTLNENDKTFFKDPQFYKLFLQNGEDYKNGDKKTKDKIKALLKDTWFDKVKSKVFNDGAGEYVAFLMFPYDYRYDLTDNVYAQFFRNITIKRGKETEIKRENNKSDAQKHYDEIKALLDEYFRGSFKNNGLDNEIINDLVEKANGNKKFHNKENMKYDHYNCYFDGEKIIIPMTNAESKSYENGKTVAEEIKKSITIPLKKYGYVYSTSVGSKNIGKYTIPMVYVKLSKR